MTFKRLPQYLKLCKREREKIEHFTPTYCKLIICPWNHEKCQSMFMFLPIYNVNLRLCSPCVTNNEHCLFIEFMTRLVVRSICIERAKIFLQFYKLLINAKIIQKPKWTSEVVNAGLGPCLSITILLRLCSSCWGCKQWKLSLWHTVNICQWNNDKCQSMCRCLSIYNDTLASLRRMQTENILGRQFTAFA